MPIPSSFGKYERIRRIAQGGMGDVFLARQKGVAGFDRLVILKTLKENFAEEQEFIDQFLDEARVASTLNHPNIVSIFEIGEANGIFFIAMEFIAGVDLTKLWLAAAQKKTGLPFQVSVQIIHDAALGLAHAHHALDVNKNPLQIVHRDISPQNLMVRGDGVTKIVDFGIAKARNRRTQTTVGTVKGKLQYMSPEQIRGEPLSGKSDQFALGIVLWEMCTGKRLFKAQNESETIQKILEAPIPPPSRIVPHFPPILENTILRMLEKDAAQRFESLSHVANALRIFLEEEHASQNSVAQFVQNICSDELDSLSQGLATAPPHESSSLSEQKTIGEAPKNAFRDETFTEVEPEPLYKNSSSIRIKTSGVLVFLEKKSELEQWILDGKFAREDQMSSDGEHWVRLDTIPYLVPIFRVADRRRALAYSKQQAVATQASKRPSEFKENEHKPKYSQAAPIAYANFTSPLNQNQGLQKQKKLSPLIDFGSDNVLPIKNKLHTSAASPTQKNNGAQLILLGIVLALVGTFAFLHALAPHTVFKMSGGHLGFKKTTPLPLGLTQDDTFIIKATLQTLSTIDDAVERESQKAMLYSAWVNIEKEQARLLKKSAHPHDKAQAKALLTNINTHLNKAYKAATAARSADPSSSYASLAMAAYQGANGTLSEMDADLQALKNAPTLQQEGKIIALGARIFSSQLQIKTIQGFLVEVNSLANAQPADERLRYLRILLLTKALTGPTPWPMAPAQIHKEIQRAQLLHATDKRYLLLKEELKILSKRP